jgi:hypothetical protein
MCALLADHHTLWLTTVKVFVDLEVHKIFSSLTNPLLITITKGLPEAPVGKVEPSTTEIDVSVLDMPAESVVSTTAASKFPALHKPPISQC